MSVYGTGGGRIQRLAAFLGSRLRITIPFPEGSGYYQRSAGSADLPTNPLPTAFTRHFRPPGCPLLLRPHFTFVRRYGNINPLAIGCACRLCLRSRLTLIRLALIRNPGSYGDQVSHLVYRYLCLHVLFRTLHRGLPPRLLRNRNAPLPDTLLTSVNPQLRYVS